MRRFLAALMVVMMTLGVVTAPAAAYTFPSTNDLNREDGFPHVNLVEQGVGYVTLQFVNDTNSLAFFEYQIDGVQAGSGAHPIVIGDTIHPGVAVDGRGNPDPVVVVQTLNATDTVAVRLALGGERDWDFDWVVFDVLPDAQTQDDCKNGGFAAFGFSNQGQCIQFVNTSKDSRP